MRGLYILFLVDVLMCTMPACRNGTGTGIVPDASVFIVGKWNLQQQKSVIYVNGLVQNDTTLLASPDNVSYAQFNKDNTFSSVGMSSVYLTGGNLVTGTGTLAAVDSTSGNYRLSNSSLNLSAGLAGFAGLSAYYGSSVTAGSVPTFNLISRSSQISVLTASKFNLHIEIYYNSVISNVTTNYKQEEDYYYTR